jgi:hypothetical protein
MFTFNLIREDGSVWMTIQVQGSGPGDAGRRIPRMDGITVVLV